MKFLRILKFSENFKNFFSNTNKDNLQEKNEELPIETLNSIIDTRLIISIITISFCCICIFFYFFIAIRNLCSNKNSKNNDDNETDNDELDNNKIKNLDEINLKSEDKNLPLISLEEKSKENNNNKNNNNQNQSINNTNSIGNNITNDSEISKENENNEKLNNKGK